MKGLKPSNNNKKEERLRPEETNLSELQILRDMDAKSSHQPDELGLLSSKLLNSFFSEKIETLKELIGRIKARIKARREMEEAFVREIDREITQFEVSLKEINPSCRTSPELAEKAHPIEKSIALLREQKREHKAKSFKDIVWLEKEMTQLLLEYKELLRLSRLIEHG